MCTSVCLVPPIDDSNYGESCIEESSFPEQECVFTKQEEPYSCAIPGKPAQQVLSVFMCLYLSSVGLNVFMLVTDLYEDVGYDSQPQSDSSQEEHSVHIVAGEYEYL